MPTPPMMPAAAGGKKPGPMRKWHIVLRPGAPKGTWAMAKTMMNGFVGGHTYDRPVFTCTTDDENAEKLRKGLKTSLLDKWILGPVTDDGLEALKAKALERGEGEAPVAPAPVAPTPVAAPALASVQTDGPAEASEAYEHVPEPGEAEEGKPSEFDQRVSSELKQMLDRAKELPPSTMGPVAKPAAPVKQPPPVTQPHASSAPSAPAPAATTAVAEYDGPGTARDSIVGGFVTDEEAMGGLDPHEWWRVERASRARGPDRDDRQWFRFKIGTFVGQPAILPELGRCFVVFKCDETGNKTQVAAAHKWPDCMAAFRAYLQEQAASAGASAEAGDGQG